MLMLIHDKDRHKTNDNKIEYGQTTYTVTGKKWNQQSFRYNFDKYKCIVAILARNVIKVMQNQTNTTKVHHT